MKNFLLTLFCLSFYFNVTSQVYIAGFMFPDYNDVDPDTLLNYVVAPYTNETYSANVFGISDDDIEITAHGAVSSGGSDAYIKITSINPNIYISQGRLDSVFVAGNSTWNITKIARVIGTGETINALDAVWDNTELYLTDHSGHNGGNKNVNDWIGGEKFIGLRYMAGNDLAYGWIRVECPHEDSCYVKDYSFSPVVSGIKEVKKKELSVYPNPTNNIFYLNNISPVSFSISKLKILDMYGREIKFDYEINANNIKIETDPVLPAGCYFLEYLS
jgi:hypothetical protein